MKIQANIGFAMGAQHLLHVWGLVLQTINSSWLEKLIHISIGRKNNNLKGKKTANPLSKSIKKKKKETEIKRRRKEKKKEKKSFNNLAIKKLIWGGGVG